LFFVDLPKRTPIERIIIMQNNTRDRTIRFKPSTFS